jgi:isopentenyl phosphate kinase
VTPRAEDAPVVLIKFGGSLLTDKRKPETVRRAELDRLAAELAAARQATGRPVLLGHGSGSFGHAAAERFRIGDGFQVEGQLHGAAATQDSAARLNRLVIAALLAAGESPFTLAPSSFLLARLGRPVRGSTEALTMAFERGFLPVVYGDLLLDSDLGVSIASTESVLIYLATRLLKQGVAVSHAYWLGDTDGVYDEHGEPLASLHPEELVRLRPALGGARGFDVTGGMQHRVESAVRLAELGVTSWIANGKTPGLLARALRGEPVPGTRIATD